MNLFFDTSALVKYFHEELGTDRVTTLIHENRQTIWLLELARVEFLSALFKKRRTGELNDEKLQSAITGFDAEYATFNIQPLGHPITAKAEVLIKKHGKMHGLRTLDALHLAAFSLVAEQGWHFVATDDILAEVTRLEGYQVINPLVPLGGK